MALAGFKKQFNKVDQFINEKVGGANDTELDDNFAEMGRKTDVIDKLTNDLISDTLELLQPNPVYKAKLAAVKSFSKLGGSAKSGPYPQPESILGECMSKYGKELGSEFLFGEALVDAGETYKQMADIKYSLEDNVKQNFIEPLQQLQSKDLKEIKHHRKKFEGRRLDFCYMKRKQSAKGASEQDITNARDKFEESKELAAQAMHNLLENDVEFIAQLSTFIDAQAEYHRQTLDLLQPLSETLSQKSSSKKGTKTNSFAEKI